MADKKTIIRSREQIRPATLKERVRTRLGKTGRKVVDTVAKATSGPGGSAEAANKAISPGLIARFLAGKAKMAHIARKNVATSVKAIKNRMVPMTAEEFRQEIPVMNAAARTIRGIKGAAERKLGRINITRSKGGGMRVRLLRGRAERPDAEITVQPLKKGAKRKPKFRPIERAGFMGEGPRTKEQIGRVERLLEKTGERRKRKFTGGK